MTTSDDKQDCVCGGCLTGTPCCNATSPIKTSALYGTYVYAAPDVQLMQTVPPTTTDTSVFAPNTPNTILLEELVRDLLDRTQKLEEQYQQLTEAVATKKLADTDSVKSIQAGIDNILDIIRADEKK